MNSRIEALIAIIAVLLAAPSPLEAGLIAVTGGDQVASILYELNPITGAVVREIGDTGLTHVTGIAIHPQTGAIYAHRNVRGIDSGFLYSLDPITAAATLIGPTHLSTPDLTFSSNGTLYGWTVFYEQDYPGITDIDELVTFDLTTGLPTQVGLSTGFFPNQIGLAFDRNGTLYLKSSDRLYTIDPSTGEPSEGAFLSADTRNVLAFDAANQAYSISRNYIGPPNQNFVSSYLHRIDITTGEVTTIGDNLGLQITALAFTNETAAVPEPQHIVALLTLGAFFIRRRRFARANSQGFQIVAT